MALATRRYIFLLQSALVLFALPAYAQNDTPAANPGRPTVTNPATLPPVGYVQFEQGYLGSLNSPNTASQYGISQVTKLAVASRVMVQAQFQPFAVSRFAGDPQAHTGFGDVLVGPQVVLYAPAEPPAGASKTADAPKSRLPIVALGYLGRIHTGNTADIDLGGFAQSFLLLLSGDLGGFHYDTNYIVNQQSGFSNLMPTRNIHRAQFVQTLSVNHALLNPRLQLSVELYHFTQPLLSADAAGKPVARANLVDMLVAPSFQLRPNLVLDCGFSHGFTTTSTKWQSFAGFTYLLPHRLWSSHTR